MLTTTLREPYPRLYISGLMPDGRHSMSASLIEEIKASPLLPEIIQRSAWGKAMTSFPRNDYEPDACFFGMSKAREE
jgi:hypothetical protein